MSKKHRRNAAPRVRPSSAPANEPSLGVAAGSSERSGRTGGFTPDYSYITRDLKRIGILAGTFILLLLIGTFFVR
ncbi:MAG: hypothetical protein AB1449_04650 [Chloroflexota bacterium]